MFSTVDCFTWVFACNYYRKSFTESQRVGTVRDKNNLISYTHYWWNQTRQPCTGHQNKQNMYEIQERQRMSNKSKANDSEITPTSAGTSGEERRPTEIGGCQPWIPCAIQDSHTGHINTPPPQLKCTLSRGVVGQIYPRVLAVLRCWYFLISLNHSEYLGPFVVSRFSGPNWAGKTEFTLGAGELICTLPVPLLSI